MDDLHLKPFLGHFILTISILDSKFVEFLVSRISWRPVGSRVDGYPSRLDLSILIQRSSYLWKPNQLFNYYNR